MKPRILFFWLHAALAMPLAAQEGKLVVLQPQPKELKRTAHHPRIPPGQLRDARRILQEATDLAGKVDPPQLERFQEPAILWRMIDPTRAQAAIERLIDLARSLASAATDFVRYQHATSTAFSLMAELHEWEMEAVRRFALRDSTRPSA